MINKAFGEDVIKSYIKLRSIELNEFNKTEKLDKSKPVSDWERKNTLDCYINCCFINCSICSIIILGDCIAG